MVRELGVDAAEARPEESAQTPTTKTAAAKSVKFFIPESLILSAELATIARAGIPRGATASALTVAIEDQPLS
jgi:hypothetical protein